jgi:molybdopterin-guanine dinucleotide biosynthesis adapter protein
MKIPQIFLFSGNSETGKTRMITNLIPLLHKDGYKVGVTKSRQEKFDLDREGKDSWKYNEAGADGILLYSPEQTTLFTPSHVSSLKDLVEKYFFDYDIVLAEGFSKEAEINKIAFLRQGISENLKLPIDNLVAVVSDFPYTANVPVFHPDQIQEIFSFVKVMIFEERHHMFQLHVNRKPVGMKNFVKDFMKNTILAMVESLKLKDDDISDISINISDPYEDDLVNAELEEE